MNYSTFIKEKLVYLINEMDQYHWLFTRNAEKDFSRIKNVNFGLKTPLARNVCTTVSE